MRNLLIIAVIPFFIQGCASGLSNFYHDASGCMDVTTLPNVIISQDEPEVFCGRSFDEDYQMMTEKGYMQIGTSGYHGPCMDWDDAKDEVIAQAKKVHASVALLRITYLGSNNSQMPMSFPSTSTSNTYMSGGAYGSAGGGTYSGTATTTTTTMETIYIPTTVHRCTFHTTYWIQLKQPICGLVLITLTTEARQEIGSNKGRLVYAVINDSPAFRADIVKGDVI